MTNDDLLIDAYGRVREGVHRLVGTCSPEALAWRPDPGANSIAWLVWHLSRVQDDHIAELAGSEQVWTAQGFLQRFKLPYPIEATGYGQSAEEVGQFSLQSSELLTSYLDAVHSATLAFLSQVSDDDLRKIVDRSYDPPVTMAVRLISVLADDLQHLGQAAYVKGLFERSRS
jgi:hypothetical protein